MPPLNHEVFRYAPRPLDTVSPGAAERFIRFEFRRGLLESDTPVVYLTPDSMSERMEAQERLATTYSPLYRNTLEIPPGAPIASNEGKPCDPFDTSVRLPRVWPAFGHRGFGREVLLFGKDLPPLRVKERAPLEPQVAFRGGWTDPFHQDDVLPVGIESLVSASFRGQRLRTTLNEQDVGPITVKVAPPGLVVHWVGYSSTQRWEFAVSVGHRQESGGTAIRAWGSRWIDVESSTGVTRNEWGPMTSEVFLPVIQPRLYGYSPSLDRLSNRVVGALIVEMAQGLLSLNPSTRPNWVSTP